MEGKNNFILDLIAGLKKAQSKKQVQSDIKTLGDIKIPLVGFLSKIKTKAQVKQDLENVSGTIELTGKASKKGLSTSIKDIVKQAQEIADKNNIKINISDVDDAKLNSIITKLQQLTQISNITSTQESIDAINKEAKAMLEIVDSARKAALEKLEFAEANRRVRESADNTVDAITHERNAMNSLNDINYILDSVNMNAEQGASVFRRFGNILNEAFATYTIANLLEDAIYEIIDAGREGVEVVKELNDVATSLRMATGDSLKDTNALVDSYNDLGQELGSITRDVSESADAWLRQGHSIEDTNTLITDSMMLSKIANLESAQSTEYLTSIMQAYKLKANEVIDTVSKLSAVDLESASDAGGLAKSLSRCASAAEMAGVSMNTLIGYIATVKEVTQDSDEAVGNMFKSVFSRMNQIRAGKFVDLETGEALNDTEKVLNKIGIVTRDLNNQLIDSEKILDSIGKSWHIYDSNTQKALATAVAGTYQYNKFIALMQSYGDAINYANIAANSQGIAEEKFGYYLDSLEAKTNALQASLENLATTTLPDELYASVLDTSKAVVDLIADTDVLKGLLIGLGVSGSIYGFQRITSSLGDVTQGFANLGEAMNMTRSGTVGIDSMQRLINITGGLSQSQTRLLLSTNNLTDAQRVAILMGQGMEQQQAEQTIQTWGVATAQNGATASTITFTGALRGLWATLMANPLVLVTTLISAGVMAISAYNQKIQETSEKAGEALDEVKSNVSELNSLIKEYNNLQLSNEWDNTSIEEKKRLQKEINALIDDESKKLDIVNGKYEDVTAELYKQKLAKLSEQEKSAYDALEAEKEALWNENQYNDFSFKYGYSNKKGVEYYDDLDTIEYYTAKYDDILKAWKKTNISANTSTSAFVGTEEINNVEELISTYDRLKQMSQEMYDNGDTGVFYDSVNSYLDEIETRIIKIKGYETDFDEAQAVNSLGKILTDPNNGFGGYIETLEEYKQVAEYIANSDYEDKDSILNVLASDFSEFASQIKNASDSVSSFADETESIKFTEAFNAESFKDSAEALKELAISGELSPETLTSTKEYITLLEQTGLTAEEAIEKIRGIAVAESSLSDVMGSMSSLAKLMNEVTSEIADSGQLSFDTLQSIASKYPTLEKYVTDYLNGVEGAEENLVSALQEQYNRDLDNYREYYVLKQQNDEGWYKNYITNTSSWVVDLASQYDIDLKNYATYLDAKSKLESEIKQAREDLETARVERNVAVQKSSSIHGMFNPALSAANKKYEEAKNKVDNLEKIINDIISGYENSVPDTNKLLEKYQFGGSGLSSPTSTKDAHKEEFEQRLADLKHLHEMNKISDAEYYNELDRLNQKYFANRKEYLNEYRQYEEEVYKGLLSVQEDSINAINKLIDLRIDMIKDIKEDEIDALEESIKVEKEKLDLINEQIDARKKAIELAKDEADNEKELAEKNKSVSDIQAQIDSIKYDNSASAQKKRRELEEELAEAQKDLADYISDYEYDKAIEALDKESEAYEKAYEDKEKVLQDQIDDIEAYLNDEKKLMGDAINDINGMSNTLYESMKNWAYETTGSVWEVVDAWKAAKEALETYNATNTVASTLNKLNENSSKEVATQTAQGTSSSGGGSTSNNKTDTSSSSTAPTGYKAIHTIKDGDTLSELAEYYYGDSSKWKKIQAANNNIDPKKLRVGKQLIIPYASGTKRVPYDTLAQVDELGEELVLRAGTTGRLDILTKGTSVIPADLTENLMKWGEISPASFKFNAPDYTKTFRNVNTSPVINVGDIIIQGNVDNITKSDLIKFRKDIMNDFYDSANKLRVKSGRY